jgi:hypothetical protein
MVVQQTIVPLVASAMAVKGVGVGFGLTPLLG